MLSKAAKNDIVKRFSEIFKANPSVVLVEYKGLTVAELEGLRSNLKDADTEFKIVKNTLLKIAAKDTEVEQLSDLLAGPTAIAVCESDPAAAAKVFVKTAKDMPSLVIKGGIVEGNVVGVDEITAISKLPSRLEMMAQLLGALSSPMSNLLGSLKQMQAKLLYALEAIKETKEETAVESKEEAAVEAKEEAESESKTESNEESAVETKEETAVESKEEAAVEAKEEAESESKEES
ncbi:MAG: 50S ribosomal protein L10 [Thermodesulfobacteriales bacterium]